MSSKTSRLSTLVNHMKTMSHQPQPPVPPSTVLSPFLSRLDNTLVRTLDADPREEGCFPNRKTRAVLSGHYVRIVPTPLKKPYLVAYSRPMAEEMGLTKEMVESEEFLKIFSADVDHNVLDSWCTPYAVSVYGSPILAPDHFRGRGYGDGRACSIGEFNAPTGRYELQLKGCGPTPFARQFDGRAVLRSSVREFLVSEAMHFLRVPTTRALCLTSSEEDFVDRAWYNKNVISKEYDYPPNKMMSERCAITCRAASSFLRVGQVELYQRRLRGGDEGAEESMKKFMKYCIEREFPAVKIDDDEDLGPGVVQMLDIFAQRQAHLVTNWIRVGYVQGNMNSDNCLLAGLTMDYGPLGWMTEYDPLFTPFTSDPDKKFGFERQPLAAHVNLATLTEALMPLIEKDEELKAKAEDIVRHRFPQYILKERNEMRRTKLGLKTWEESFDSDLWEPLYKVMIGLDYTMFWRELSYMKGKFDVVEFLEKVCYDNEPGEEKIELMKKWIEIWKQYLDKEGLSVEERQKIMLHANPKFVPREWMLVEAYEAAEKKDYEPLRQMQRLFEKPYDEHDDESTRKYYSKTPEEYRRRAGVAFYSCSS